MEDSQFEALLKQHENALKRFIYLKMPGKSDAEDVFQETALAAFRGRAAVKSSDSFKAWLIQIARNKCRDFYIDGHKRADFMAREYTDAALASSRYGLISHPPVLETLDALNLKDRQLLKLIYWHNLPQDDVARLLNIPVGTVKSRLHTAKQRFKAAYPCPPFEKGAGLMKTLPQRMPDYQITFLDEPPFPVKWEELMGWFIVPRLGEKLSWAMYDFPEKKRTEQNDMRVEGRASVHGIEGVEIVSVTHDPTPPNSIDGQKEVERRFIAQLTDSHCRILAHTHVQDGVKHTLTFLDGDDFLRNWGFGEDNCGNEIHLSAKGIIRREGDRVTYQNIPEMLDVVGRCRVAIHGRTYDTVCVMDIENYDGGVATEQYVDRQGRTVLWRRFNRDDWAIGRYKQKWTERLPDNERLFINGGVYVHWYDCITDYIL